MDPACWIDGRVVGRQDVLARENELIARRGCYTTARVRQGRARWLERHVRRLQRDGRQLGIGEVAAERIQAAFAELSEATFGDGEGIVRLQASASHDGAAHLVGMARSIGEERPAWRAITAPAQHEGWTPFSGVKRTHDPVLARTRDALQRAGADEAVLFDDAGFAIEGSRTNLFLVDREDVLVTPDLARGGVAGIAREIVLERGVDIVVRSVTRAELAAAREIIAVNAVRGARPVVSLDDESVGDGRPGRAARALAALLADE